MSPYWVMEDNINKPPSDYELREEIRKCCNDPDKLMHLFFQYAAIILLYVTEEASKKLKK